MKCVVLQEVRWEDVGTTKISQITIFNGKCRNGHSLGMGFAESIIHAVKNFKDKNPRLSTLTLKTDNVDTVLINIHAPMREKDEEEKEYFYASLANVFHSCEGSFRIALRDFNAKLGQEVEYRSYIGTQSLHTITNDNGTKLIDFAICKGLVIKSTMFPRKNIHKYTWISPDGKHKNRIDHVLVTNRFKNSIVNIRSLRGVGIDSDHVLLGIWVKVKLKRLMTKNQRKKARQFDINKLKDSVIRKNFEDNIMNQLQNKHTPLDDSRQ